MRVARLGENVRQRDFGRRRVGAAQHVVGAEFDDDRVRVFRHAPVEARQAVGGGVAGDAGVDDLDVPALRFQRARQHVGKRLARRQAVAGGEAVAERDQLQRLGRRRRAERRAPRRAPAPPPGRRGEESHMRRAAGERIVMAKGEPAIELADVDLSLGEGVARVHILRGVSMTIGRGEAVGLVGASGSGKSTLLMIVAGLERPDRGSVVVDGQRIDAMGEDKLARFRGQRIGIVFQSFHLIPTMTALENVAAPLELAGVPRRLRPRRAPSWRWSAFPTANATIPPSSPAASSSASRWRARLAPRPSVMIADEPTGNLDEATGRRDHRAVVRRARAQRRDAGARHPRSRAGGALRPHAAHALRAIWKPQRRRRSRHERALRPAPPRAGRRAAALRAARPARRARRPAHRRPLRRARRGGDRRRQFAGAFARGGPRRATDGRSSAATPRSR